MAFNRLVTFFITITLCILHADETSEYVADDQEKLTMLRICNGLNKNWLNQNYIHRELQDASRYGKQEIVALLLSHTTGTLLINQYNINYALRSAAINNHHGIVELLLSCDNLVGPDQCGINQAFCDVVTYGLHVDMAERLLTSPEGQLKPDNKSIASAHQDAVTYGHKNMIDLIDKKLK